MDEKYLEQAALLEQHARDIALADVRRKEGASHIQPPGFNGECECGTIIEPARVALGYYICIECANDNETRARLLGTYTDEDLPD